MEGNNVINQSDTRLFLIIDNHKLQKIHKFLYKKWFVQISYADKLYHFFLSSKGHNKSKYEKIRHQNEK